MIFKTPLCRERWLVKEGLVCCCCFSISIHNISSNLNHPISVNRATTTTIKNSPTKPQKVFQSKKRRMMMSLNPVPRCMKKQVGPGDWKTTTSTYFENGSRTHLRHCVKLPRNVYDCEHSWESARSSSAPPTHRTATSTQLLTLPCLQFVYIFLFITLVIRATLPTIQGWWAKNLWTAGSVHFFIDQTP